MPFPPASHGAAGARCLWRRSVGAATQEGIKSLRPKNVASGKYLSLAQGEGTGIFGGKFGFTQERPVDTERRVVP